MAEDESNSESGPGIAFTPRTAMAIVGGVVAVVVVLALVFQGDGGDSAAPGGLVPPTTRAVTDGLTTSAAPPPLDVERPEIPPIDCGPLWSDDELVLALGSEERSIADLSSMTLSQGEVCVEQLAADPAYFIRIEPGDPSDFADGASLNGVTGVPVADVGDAAAWFGGDTESDAPALISVYVETRVGELFFRLSIGRPDLSSEERLAVITELARAVVPYFPYVEVEPPDPLVIQVERNPVSREPLTLDELVVDGEAQGEWTLGEGLVAALRLLADEPSEFEPPTSFDLTSGSATGVIWMARDYLESAADDETRAELERLLDATSFPELFPDPSADTGTGEEEAALGTGSGAPALISFSLAPTQEPEVPSCGVDAVWFDVDCTVVEDLGGVRFAYPAGAVEGSVAGWDKGDIDAIRTAIQTTVAEYTKYGTLQRADLLLTPLGDGFGEGLPMPVGDRCLVQLRRAANGLASADQSFFVALELAGCFLDENLSRDVFRSGYAASKWWYQGLVLYLAAEVYPRNDTEWNVVGQLEASEIESSLQDRTVHNWPFFRSVAASGGGAAAAIDMVSGLTNAPSIQAQQVKLAANSSSEPALHVFHQELTDGRISDAGGGGRYSPSSSAEMELSGPTVILDTPIRFGVTRYELTVAPGKRACLEYDISGNVLTSWRQGRPGTSGSWTFDIPEEITGTSVFVVTTVEEGESFSISAEVSEEPDCEEDDEDNPGDFEFPDCGICDPSFYYRLFGAFLAALN